MGKLAPRRSETIQQNFIPGASLSRTGQERREKKYITIFPVLRDGLVAVVLLLLLLSEMLGARDALEPKLRARVARMYCNTINGS